ncbi:hypothetical protein Taro_048375 [Colocasia esculenta]|uniref:Uncharacterized protein n=1 Tax=Colocasia esculenta TaxID=4460 RepID=A0A843X6F7_COLES|nr:hypothetical protein [Colocasia esculenta]
MGGRTEGADGFRLRADVGADVGEALNTCSAVHRKIGIGGNHGHPARGEMVTAQAGEKADAEASLYSGSNLDNHHSIPRQQFGGRGGGSGQQSPGGDDQDNGGSGGGNGDTN